MLSNPDRGYIPPQVPSYGSKVLYVEDYRPDPDFVKRICMLMGDMTDQKVADKTRLNRNHVRDLRLGRITAPTYSMLKKLAGLQEWATVSWLAEGRDEGEKNFETIEELHGWDVQMAKQRLRQFERILKKARQSAGLTPDQASLAEQALGDTQTAKDQANPESDDETLPGTAA